MVNACVVAHCPMFGVNVYVVVVVLSIAGDHVPIILFNEVVGNETVSPIQIGLIAAKLGVTGCKTSTVII